MDPERRANLIRQFEVHGNPIQREIEDRYFHITHFGLAGLLAQEDVRQVLLQAYADGKISFIRWCELADFAGFHGIYSDVFWEREAEDGTIDYDDLEHSLESMPVCGCSEYAEEIFLFLLWEKRLIPERRTSI